MLKVVSKAVRQLLVHLEAFNQPELSRASSSLSSVLSKSSFASDLGTFSGIG
jgi:hypothetical protein